MLKEVSKALFFGVECMDDKWLANIVERGETWIATLDDLLSDQNAEFKADYYEKIFYKSNPDNADFLMRMAYRLSEFYFKLTVKKLDSLNFKESNRLINKAAQYYNTFIEFGDH
jgi:hypothetical protein